MTANPEIKEFDLDGDEDFIIMGCDGIWETKSNEEMVEYIYERLKKKEKSEEIVQELLHEIISPDY